MIYGFRLHQPVSGGLWPAKYALTIVGAGTITMGDVIKEGVGTGCDAADAVTDQISAVCIGFLDKDDIPYDTKPAGFGSATSYTEAAGGDTVVTHANNFTSRTTATYGIKAELYPVYNFLLTARLTGTDTGYQTPGYYCAVYTSDSTKIDTSTCTQTYNADSTQFQIREVDPVDSTRDIVTVIMTEVAAD